MDSYFYEEAEQGTHYVKKKARKTLSIIACTSVISTLLSYVFYALVSVFLPYLTKIISSILILSGKSKIYAMAFAENFIISEQLNHFISIIATLLCFFLPFALVAKVLDVTEKDCAISVKGPVMKSLPFVYCASLMMASAASLVTGGMLSFLFPDAYSRIISDTVDMYGSSTNPASLILSFVSMCVLAPIAEEFVYRGIAFGCLKRFGVSFAAVSSSLLFGLAHANPEQISYAFVFGLVLCAVTSRTGNLKTAIIMHFINNLIGYISAYIIPLISFGAADALFNVVYNLFTGAFAIVGMVFLFKKQKNSADTEEKKSVPISCFFCTGTVLVIALTVTHLISEIL